MKKILFILSNLERGGIPRVTLNLAEILAPEKVAVDIFCGNPRGIFTDTLREISHVHLLPGSLLLRALMCNYRKENDWFKYYAIGMKLFRCTIQKVLKKDLLIFAEQVIGKKLSGNHYDAVFACSEGLPADIALQIRSPKRCVWIHNDYDHDCSANMPGLMEKLGGFDLILCVAEHARISLCQHFPNASGHTCTIYNIVNDLEIQQRSGDSIAEQYFPQDGVMNIISVGRFFEAQKHFSIIPEICAELKKRGVYFRWYLIGNGSPAETQILLDAVKKYEPGDSFVMLGEKSNPYPYLKNADLFVLTSRYETYPTVINEAKALGTPVLSTDFKGSDEIMTAEDGMIVPIEEFTDAIERFCKGNVHRKECCSFAAHNQKILQKFYQIVGEYL